jgi:hypothetical protein
MKAAQTTKRKKFIILITAPRRQNLFKKKSISIFGGKERQSKHYPILKVCQSDLQDLI